MSASSDDFLDQHLVRYRDLIPCTTAFIDTRTPGSKEKENFTIIGPGVAENPDQHVHITRAHGFNIGGARQPPNCVNSQHSHETAEVFVVHTGVWSFNSGEDGTDGKVVLQPGDVISIPTACFRGFENVGDDEGFLFAVLGGDDPGRVTWAPYVFEQAQDHGLVLLENGALVDTTAGESVPDGIKPMPVTSQATIDALQRLDDAALESCVARRATLSQLPAHRFPGHGITERCLIGNTQHGGDAKPPMSWPHGFRLHHLELEAGAASNSYRQPCEEVLMVQSGNALVSVEGHDVSLGPGDVFTAPKGAHRTLSNPHQTKCEIYVVHGGDAPTRMTK